MIKLYVDHTPGLGTKVIGSHFGDLIITKAYPHDYVFTSEATIVNDPSMNTKFDPNWIIAKSCDDLAAYYRYQIISRFNIRLLKPSFDSHISIVVGEEPIINVDNWNHFNGNIVRFKYTNDIFTNGMHWWLRVECEEMNYIREYFGLNNDIHAPDGSIIKNPFHLTIGKTHPSDIS